MNPLPALTVFNPVIFLSNLSNTEEVAWVANLGKIFLTKGTAGSNSACGLVYLTF